MYYRITKTMRLLVSVSIYVFQNGLFKYTIPIVFGLTSKNLSPECLYLSIFELTGDTTT